MPTTETTKHVTREEESRKKVWKAPGKLETPTPPPGYKYRWVRYQLLGDSQEGNVLYRLKQHYEPVTKEEYGDPLCQTLEDGKFSGVVVSGDLMLMKVPLDVVKQRNAYYDKLADRQMQAVDDELMRNQNEMMPISRKRKSSVSVGGPRNPAFQDQESEE